MRLRLPLAALGLSLAAGCAPSMPDVVEALPVEPTPTAPALTPATLDDPELVQRYQATITPSELAGHLYVYADDYMGGRETGEAGQRFAAKYLAGQYQAMDIGPKGTGADNGNYGLDAYLQPFELETKRTVRQTITAMRGDEVAFASELAEGSAGPYPLVSIYGTVEDASSAPIVYGGYASDEELAGLDLDGAYVLLQAGTPDDPADRSQLQPRAMKAGAAGARAVIFPLAPAAEALAARAANTLNGGRLALPADGADGDGDELPPIFGTGVDIANAIVDGDVMTAEPGATPHTLQVVNETEGSRVPTENVLAYIEGSDLSDEVIVISAHLDHIGIEDGEGDVINNGADDDGSGTISLLEIAEAFKMAKDEGHGPRRSILFLHVTGEEKGLLGSAYYADREPVLPLASTVANLNIDMIGRHDPSYEGRDEPYVYVIGAELISTDIDEINTNVNAATGLGLDLSKRYNSPDDPNRFFARSDHWNFGKHEIPFIFYFTGTHEDYHQPGDEADKIDYDRMAQISRLVFGTAWQIANQDARPGVSGVGFNP